MNPGFIENKATNKSEFSEPFFQGLIASVLRQNKFAIIRQPRLQLRS